MLLTLVTEFRMDSRGRRKTKTTAPPALLLHLHTKTSTPLHNHNDACTQGLVHKYTERHQHYSLVLSQLLVCVFSSQLRPVSAFFVFFTD